MSDTIILLPELLRQRAAEQPDKEVFRFYTNSQTSQADTYASLLCRAESIGKLISPSGTKALLLLAPGQDFIHAIYACFLSGIVAIPIHLQMTKRGLAHLMAAFNLTHPDLILSTSHIRERVGVRMPEFGDQVPWVLTDLVADCPDHFRGPELDPDDIALIQWTSGSTDQPKGVMINGRQIMHTLALTNQHFGLSNHPDPKAVFWLPPSHDMGLFSAILQPVYTNGQAHLMSPSLFLQSPRFWLELMSETGAQFSGAPDFGYVYCCQKLTKEDCQGLNLSQWEVAFTGSEPIRHDTILRFSDLLADVGFSQKAFFPCYGLAEATVFVSGGPLEDEFQIASHPMYSDRQLVSVGRIPDETVLKIVDTDSNTPVNDGMIGEIWISGDIVSNGYYRDPELTERRFNGKTDDGFGPFLKTGDLGFMRHGHLYIVGRKKDMLIVHGQNIFAEDIEAAIREDVPGYSDYATAVVGNETGVSQEVLVFQEAPADDDGDKLASQIYEILVRDFSILEATIYLVRKGALPRTSSGKLRRKTCLEILNRGHFVFKGPFSFTLSQSDNHHPVSPEVKGDDYIAAILDYVIEVAAATLVVPFEQIDPTVPVSNLGFTSLQLADFQSKLSVFVDMETIGAYREKSLDEIAGLIEANTLLTHNEPSH